jgi:hypothetical protein
MGSLIETSRLWFSGFLLEELRHCTGKAARDYVITSLTSYHFHFWTWPAAADALGLGYASLFGLVTSTQTPLKLYNTHLLFLQKRKLATIIGMFFDNKCGFSA